VRGNIFELVGLLFVPDNFVVMMQKFGSAGAVQRFIVAGEDRQTPVAVLFAEIAHAFCCDIGVLFRTVNLAFHVFVWKQVRIKNDLTDIAQKTDALCPVSPLPHAANQRAIVDIELQHFVHFFKQMLHVMFRMTRAVTDQPDIRIDKLQLQHFLMVTRTV
jgi:hypothetical protein